MVKQRFAYVVLLALLGLLSSTAATPVFGFETGTTKWLGTPWIGYSIDPNLDANLGAPGARDAVFASSLMWNTASYASLNEIGWDPNGSFVSATYFDRDVCSDGRIVDATTYVAVSCETNVNGVYPARLSRMRTFFSLSRRWAAFDACDYGSNLWNVRNTALHEFGHWFWLDDLPWNPPSYAVMQYACEKSALTEDDKRGATLMYGPYTGWEGNEANGRENDYSLWKDVAGYFNTWSPPPELGWRGPEVAPMWWGSRYEMMAGYAQSNYSFVYFQPFTFADNTNDGHFSQRYVTITPGMRLQWHQYNYLQATMGVDFETTDGTTLRDSGIVDQNGISVHPSLRSIYSTGQWLWFDIDLSPLAGKTIMRYWIAYDNGATGTIGQFRAYFDNLHIVY